MSTAVVGAILVAAFQIFGNVGTISAGVTYSVDVNKDAYYAIEKLVSAVKDGGRLDYEEYWNRAATWPAGGGPSAATGMVSGHYPAVTGFGNFGRGGGNAQTGAWTASFGAGKYFCQSANASFLSAYYASNPALGCGHSGSLNSAAAASAGGASATAQRYGEYRLQHIDYNGDADNKPDEDGNGSPVGDADDKDLGSGPQVFDAASAFSSGGWRELYLVRTFPRFERTYLRYSVKRDPYLSGAAWPCDLATGSGAGCLGNIQILKMVGKDLGDNHLGTLTGAADGQIDTWACDSAFDCRLKVGAESLPSGADGEWVDLFPEYVNVKSVAFYPWPNKDFRYAWEDAPDKMANPFVRLRVTMGLSGKQRYLVKKFAGDQDSTYATTINLSEY